MRRSSRRTIFKCLSLEICEDVKVEYSNDEDVSMVLYHLWCETWKIKIAVSATFNKS